MAGVRPDIAANARLGMGMQLKQLVRRVDDLLDVSRITSGKLVLKKEQIELHKVVENAIESARPVIHSRSHQLKVELPAGPVFLYGDETRLAQVFSNLLNNAAKYTDANGKIEFRAELVGARVVVVILVIGF